MSYTPLLNSIYDKFIKVKQLIKITGFNPIFNPNKNEKIAKRPPGNLNNCILNSIEELSRWIQAGGWLGIRLNGLTALDVDKNEYQIDFVKWYFKIKNLQPAIQKTKNGFHYFFKGENFSNSNYLSKAGIELTIKSKENQYIIIEPSTHKEWVYLPENDFSSIPELPKIFQKIDKFDKKQIINAIVINIAFSYQNKLLNGYEDVELSFCHFLIKQGFNNDYIHKSFQFIYPDYEHSRTQQIIERTKQRINNQEEVKGFKSFYHKIKDEPDFEVLSKLFDLYFKVNKSGYHKNEIKIKNINIDLPEIMDIKESFPIHNFPGHFKELCIYLSCIYNIPVKVPAMTLFFLIGGAIGTTRKIFIKDNWLAYPNFVFADIGVSGTGKDHIIQKINDIIAVKQFENLNKINEEEIRRYKEEKLIYERKIKEFKQGKIDSLPNEPGPPKRLRYYVNDITMEALASILYDNPRGVIIFKNELSGFMKGMGRYLKGGASEVEKDFYIHCFDGSRYLVDRVTGKSLDGDGRGKRFELNHPLVSLYGGIQPKIFKEAFTKTDIEKGFFQRWNFLFISKDELDIEHEKKDYQRIDEIEFFLEQFIDFIYLFDFRHTERGATPSIVYLTNEAKRLNKDFRYQIDLKAHNATIEGMFSYYRKNKPLAAKIAFCLEVMELFIKYISEDKNKYL